MESTSRATRVQADELTHGRPFASRPGSCMRIDAHHSRRSPLPRVQCWDSTAHGKEAEHSKKGWRHRPQQPYVQDLSITFVRQLIGKRFASSRTCTHRIAIDKRQLSIVTKRKYRKPTYHFAKLACSSLEYGSLEPIGRQFRRTSSRRKMYPNITYHFASRTDCVRTPFAWSGSGCILLARCSNSLPVHAASSSARQ
jgi:hypothetical protein